jgi:formylglycine-generating enzyme required for sulfatase activity
MPAGRAHRARASVLRGLRVLALLCAAATGVAAAVSARAADYVEIPAATFASVIGNDASNGLASVGDFSLRVTPVTRAEFYAFVDANPQWQPEAVGRVFADEGYLSDWKPPASLTPREAAQPVTHVSWFAAQAYCETEGARLPTWNEWELAAAADATRRDARGDPAWRATILSWYSRPATAALPAVGGAPNVYGVRDLHGLVWEWVDDFNALLVDADSRTGNDPDKLKFCGAGAINLKQRENYAILMRIALLSSLKGSDSTGSLGFRCARPHPKDTP